MAEKSDRNILRLRWWTMIDRCTNPDCSCYERYGGRGITVCDRWRDSFEAFFSDMAPQFARHLTLERIDNSGPYAPENCRWATLREQGANKRNNMNLTLNGRTQNLASWCRELGLHRLTVRRRIKDLGWTPEQALTKPIQVPGKHVRVKRVLSEPRP